MKSIGIAVLVLFVAGSEAVACMPWVPSIAGQTVDAVMVVQSGKSCLISFRSSGPTESVKITQRPLHGTVTLEPIGRIRYRPAAGYVGSDTFMYARRGKDQLNRDEVRSVRVSVQVGP